MLPRQAPTTQLQSAPQSALSFTAGMAAASALFLTHGRKGIICLGDAYGGTLELLESQLPLLQIHTRFLLGGEQDQLASALEEGYGLLFIEVTSEHFRPQSTSPRIDQRLPG